MEIQLEQLVLFESDEMLFSSVKSKGRVCISTEREVFIRKLILNTRSRAILYDKNQRPLRGILLFIRIYERKFSCSPCF